DVQNTATVSLKDVSKFNDAYPANDSATVTTKVDCNADLQVTKTASLASAIPGQTIDYIVTVTNNGPAPMSFADIVVSDPNATLTLQGEAPATLAAGDHL